MAEQKKAIRIIPFITNNLVTINFLKNLYFPIIIHFIKIFFYFIKNLEIFKLPIYCKQLISLDNF